MTTKKELTKALKGFSGYRDRQRVCALYLGITEGAFSSADLRGLCKETESFNSPNFSRNLKQDSVFWVGDKNGWMLTEMGMTAATALFEGAEPLVETPKAGVINQDSPPPTLPLDPTLANEVLTASSGATTALPSEPAIVTLGTDDNGYPTFTNQVTETAPTDDGSESIALRYKVTGDDITVSIPKVKATALLGSLFKQLAK